MIERLDAIQEKRNEAARDYFAGDTDLKLSYDNAFFKAIEDAVTKDDIDFITDEYHKLPDDLKKLVNAMMQLERSWAKGYRCSVCCMTSSQAKEAGYDCNYEC